ncbi:TetR/AcrR family transcriptional regulator [Nocardia sp. CDC160]|uniref:TetR/AcrR family transcriptional regulator n=1 Tax=Nocardia sp. CDC160 TaxID=3112166 RepID=UPI002DBEDD71|nr:TetR/AcrR family transcriptional regulator [Nocardia sp. CDC160]MEC3917512.1 TetR/AcrR family transcriptional regulator [Nocardia sp. CDC160]
MGNREDLLAGARQCLFDKGYARTTVRDIATASGVSMAAIGYHFGSKEALLTAALGEATREWGDELASTLAGAPEDPETSDPLRRFASRWDAVRESVGTHRGLWAATFDALSHPETRAQLAAQTDESRAGLARLLEGAAEDDTEAARTIGALYQALLIGIAAQSLIDPETAPTGADLAEGLRRITGEPASTE